MTYVRFPPSLRQVEKRGSTSALKPFAIKLSSEFQ